MTQKSSDLNTKAQREAEEGLLTLAPELPKAIRKPIVRRTVDGQQWVLAGLS
jgi:hypothetical protein